jgi:hypothetical protein
VQTNVLLLSILRHAGVVAGRPGRKVELRANKTEGESRDQRSQKSESCQFHSTDSAELHFLWRSVRGIRRLVKKISSSWE